MISRHVCSLCASRASQKKSEMKAFRESMEKAGDGATAPPAVPYLPDFRFPPSLRLATLGGEEPGF
jgi:hypothetical protein